MNLIRRFWQLDFSTRVLVTYAIMFVVVFFSATIAFVFNNRAISEYQKEVQGVTNSVESSFVLAQTNSQIAYFDIVLTQSARNFIFTGEDLWENNYLEARTKLDDTLSTANQILGTQPTELQQFTQSRSQLTELELEAITLVNEGEEEQALLLLESNEYWILRGTADTTLSKLHATPEVGGDFSQAVLDARSEIFGLVENASRQLQTTQLVMIFLTLVAGILFVATGYYLAKKSSEPIQLFSKKIREYEPGSDFDPGGLASEVDPDLRSLIFAFEDLSKRVSDSQSRLLNQSSDQEQQIAAAKDQFERVFEESPIGIALVSASGEFIRVNESLANLLGYTQEELAEKSFQDITHPDDLDEDLGLVRQTLDGEITHYSMEKRYIHKDGHEIWILLTASLLRGSDNKPLYFVSQIHDISSQKNKMLKDEKLMR